MSRVVIERAWYGELLPHGQFCVTIPHVACLTHLGTVPLPPGETFGLGFPRCTIVDGFRFAGQAHETLNPAAWEWFPDGVWHAHPQPCIGVNPVIYDRNGLLHLSDGSVGSQGYRYVTPQNQIVSGDATYGPFHGLFEYTDLGGLWIGQAAYDGGGVQVWDGTTLRQLEPGYCVFVRANRDGEMVALAFFDAELNGVVLEQTTMTALRALPPVVVPPKPEPIGPRSDPRPADGKTYDLLAFIVGDPGTWPRKGPSHAMHQIVDGALLHFVKFGDINPNGGAYETWAVDDNWIYHLEDASAPETYHFTDPRWFPRRMPIGEVFDSGPHHAIFHRRSDCREIRREEFGRRMWVHAVYDAYYWGPDLGTRATMVVAYDATGGFHIPGRSIELGYYAFGAGSVRWDSYRSEDVYRNGRAEFNESARWARSDFYLLGGPVLAPGFTGCVPRTIPHLPPWDPTPPAPPIPPLPPVQEDDVIAYSAPVAGFLPGDFEDNGNGTVSVKKPNGKYLCVTPEGRVEERPGGGGLWESFRKGKSSLIAERDGGARGPQIFVLPLAE